MKTGPFRRQKLIVRCDRVSTLPEPFSGSHKNKNTKIHKQQPERRRLGCRNIANNVNFLIKSCYIAWEENLNFLMFLISLKINFNSLMTF